MDIVAYLEAAFSNFSRHFITNDLQFKDEDHFVLIFKSVVQVDQFVVVEMIHDVDLLPDQGRLHGVRDRDELGGKHVAGLDLSVVAQMLIQLR